VKIIIQGELPDYKTYDQAARSHRFMASQMKKEATEVVRLYALAAKAQPVIKYPVSIHITWYSKDARKDIDNVCFAKKFILDGLVQAEVLKDDSRKYVESIVDRFEIDPLSPRVEVTIVEKEYELV
jgi:Holliday junction resolvase RusA-like endonuclease